MLQAIGVDGQAVKTPGKGGLLEITREKLVAPGVTSRLARDGVQSTLADHLHNYKLLLLPPSLHP